MSLPKGVPSLCRLNVFIALLLLNLLVMPASARTLFLSEHTRMLNPALAAEVLEDPTAGIDIQALITGQHDREFVKNDRSNPVYGFSSSAYWIKFPVRNAETLPMTWILQFAYPPMQFVDFYQVSGGKVLAQQHSGLFRFSPGEHRDVGRNYAFPIRLDAFQSSTVYLRIKGENALNVSLRLDGIAHYQDFLTADSLFMGAVFGVLCGFLLYNLIIGINLKEQVYLFYSLVMFFMAGALSNMYGFTRYWFPLDLAWVPLLTPMWLFGVMFSMLLFTRVYVGSDCYQGVMGKFHLFGLVVGGFGMFLPILLPYRWVMPFAIVSLVSTVIFLTIASGFLACKKNIAAQHFIISWFPFLSAVLASALGRVGLVANSTAIEYFVPLAGASQAIFLSLGISARINQLRNEREAAVGVLVKNEKLASIGMLSAGIAHEINNPTNAIKLSAQNIESQLLDTREFLLSLLDDGNDEIREEIESRLSGVTQYAKLITDATVRITSIVDGMRSTVRNNTSEKGVVDLSEAVVSTLTLVRMKYQSVIRFETELTESLAVKGNASEMNQLLMNLIVNACQAIEDRLANEPNAPAEVRITVNRTHDDARACISIADTGCGMKEETRQRLFEPFFTTKQGDRGTGLGMGIIMRIIQNHGGTIEVSSAPGCGSTITVFLPANDLPSEA